MSQIRYIVETLHSGQSGPYGDSHTHARLTVEFFFAWLGDSKHPRSEWKPSMMWENEAETRKLLLALRCGFTENTTLALGTSKLDWLRHPSPGVWEFHTTEPYND